MAKIAARDRLIFALDVPSAVEADRLLDRLQGHISFVKVGLELYTAAGPDMIKRVRDRGMRVFLDLKFLDIEETVKRATARVAAAPAMVQEAFSEYHLYTLGRRTTIANQEIEGITGGAMDANEDQPGPFYIQGDHTGGLKFRNITIATPQR